MNFLEISLVEGAIRATVFAVAGILVYLIMRRWSPAAGSLTACSTLVLMGVVPLLAFCPWPRLPVERLRIPALNSFATRDLAPPHEPGDLPHGGPVAARPVGQPPEGQPLFIDGLLGLLDRAWTSPAAEDEPSGWTPRAWASICFLACLAIGTLRVVTGFLAMRRIVA